MADRWGRVGAGQSVGHEGYGFSARAFPTQLTEKEFESARYDELDDMANTTGTAMLGLTIGCARCHDHKFDPIPVRDYYRFINTFATTIRSEIDLPVNGDLQRSLPNGKRRMRRSPSLAKFEKDELPGALRCMQESVEERAAKAGTEDPRSSAAQVARWCDLFQTGRRLLRGRQKSRQ